MTLNQPLTAEAHKSGQMPDFASMNKKELEDACKTMFYEITRIRRLNEDLRDFVMEFGDLRKCDNSPESVKQFLEKTKGKISYENGSYEGDIVGSKANGIGTCKFSDGSVYSGEWLNNKMHGKGKMSFSGETQIQECYEGQFENSAYEGTGIYRYHHGQVYEGSYKKGQRHGKGTLRWAEGVAGYVGDWLNGKRCGYGMCLYQDGDRFYGEWSDDRWHGKGVKVEENGLVVVGTWEADQFHGLMKTYTLANTQEYYRGKPYN